MIDIRDGSDRVEILECFNNDPCSITMFTICPKLNTKMYILEFHG